MKIIIPIAGAISMDEADFMFPKPLIDIDGKPLIEYVIENLKKNVHEVKFTFVLKEPLCSKYNLDYTLSLLASSPDIVKIKNATKGATCSVLMAFDKIKPDEEIIIVNSDQIFLTDIHPAIATFRNKGAAAGVVTFESVHPRWSFALIDDEGNVLQTAEKRPISRNAIAGFYYFRTFSEFTEAAFSSVYNEEFVNEQLYLSSVMNQLILQNKKVHAFHIKNEDYISFYSPQKIKEFERMVHDKKIIP